MLTGYQALLRVTIALYALAAGAVVVLHALVTLAAANDRAR